MTPDRWQQLKKIFQSALEVHPEERSAFVAQACGEDAALRSEVESLISSHDQAGHSIQAMAAEVATEMLADHSTGSIVGKRIGHYEVLSRIGHGGMGEVFLAQDTSLGRKVALKLLPAEFTRDIDRVRRFQQEARVASALNHPNIVTIHEIGQVDDRHCMATEFIDGETLREVMRKSSMKIGEVLDVALQVAGALSAAHAAGIIHRDIKPENIMVRRDGIVKVLDFGIAKARLASASLNTQATTKLMVRTEPDQVMGTVAYMSPEQARGEEIDARSDLFSFGLVLYEMATGEPAFKGNTLAVIFDAILNKAPVSPVLLNSEVSNEFEQIITMALQKDRQMRYPSVDAMARDLRSLQLGSGTVTAPPPCERRLIVLPFRMLRPDPESDFLTFSLPDAITGSLSGLDSLVVRSSLAASRFADHDPDLRVIATEAAVNTVLTGSLLRARDQVRVSTQLVEAPSGTLIWSHTAQVDLQDIFRVHDELVNRIVDSLSVPLTAREHEVVKHDVPANPIAYELYLRANKMAQDVHNTSAARVLYQQCVDLDRQYAPAWARLGRCYWWQAKWGSHADQDLELAEQAFQRAFTLNPDLPLIHNLYARFEADRGRAILAFRRLLQRVKVSRSDAEVHVGLVQACRYAGLLQASAAAHSRALSLDPQVSTSVEYTYFMMGDYSRVLSAPKADLGYVKACTLMLLSRDPEATELIRESLKVMEGEASYSGGLQLIASIIEGNRDKSLELIETRLRWKFVDLEHCYHLSRQMSYLGETRRALETLSEITERGFCCYPALTIDPWFGPLRGTEEFQTLVEQAKALHEKARHAFIEAGGEQALNIAAG